MANYALSANPPVVSRIDQACAAAPGEVEEAKRFVAALGGSAVLVQVPSAVSCARRVHEIAAALTVPALAVPVTQFTSIDGGGHLDGVSARKYTTLLLAWLEQFAEFQRLFPENVRPVH